MDLYSLSSRFFFIRSNCRIWNMVEEQSKMAISCPYKWHSNRSRFIFLQWCIWKNDFHVLNKISICQRKEYQSCTCPIGTISIGVFVIYTLIPLSRLLRAEYFHSFLLFSLTVWSCNRFLLLFFLLVDEQSHELGLLSVIPT